MWKVFDLLYLPTNLVTVYAFRFLSLDKHDYSIVLNLQFKDIGNSYLIQSISKYINVFYLCALDTKASIRKLTKLKSYLKH